MRLTTCPRSLHGEVVYGTLTAAASANGSINPTTPPSPLGGLMTNTRFAPRVLPPEQQSSLSYRTSQRCWKKMTMSSSYRLISLRPLTQYGTRPSLNLYQYSKCLISSTTGSSDIMKTGDMLPSSMAAAAKWL